MSALLDPLPLAVFWAGFWLFAIVWLVRRPKHPQGRDRGPSVVGRPAGAADAAGVGQPREAER